MVHTKNKRHMMLKMTTVGNATGSNAPELYRRMKFNSLSNNFFLAVNFFLLDYAPLPMGLDHNNPV